MANLFQANDFSSTQEINDNLDLDQMRLELLDLNRQSPLGAFHFNIRISYYAAIRQQLGPNFFPIVQELNQFLTHERRNYQVNCLSLVTFNSMMCDIIIIIIVSLEEFIL